MCKDIKKNLGTDPVLKWKIVKKKKAINIRQVINMIIYAWIKN